MRGAFERWPAAAVFGGAIDPRFEDRPLALLSRVMDRMGSAYPIRDFGREPVRLAEDVVPFGANMAVRRDAQTRYASDVSLGPRLGSQLRGEETTIVRRILRDGLEGWWIPDARVRHSSRRVASGSASCVMSSSGQGLKNGLELPAERYSEFFRSPDSCGAKRWDRS